MRIFVKSSQPIKYNNSLINLSFAIKRNTVTIYNRINGSIKIVMAEFHHGHLNRVNRLGNRLT